MLRRLAAAVLVLALAPTARAQDVLTVAEKTDYRATSTNADVLAFIREEAPPQDGKIEVRIVDAPLTA